MPSKSFIKFVALILLLSLAPASIYILYKRTGGLESRKELAFHKNLRYQFMYGTKTVSLEELTNWGWARVCAFEGGAKQSEIDDLLGFHYADFDNLTWRNLDDHWTLLFIDSERETNWGMHRPIIAIRVPELELASFRKADNHIGNCVLRDRAALSLERSSVPLGQTPVTVSLMSEAM
jgi:hypothetical protein